MDNHQTSRPAPPSVTGYLRLPDKIEPGRYNAMGQPDPDGNLFLGMGSGIVHIWGAFTEPLRPGQRGDMTFTNVPGTYAVTGNFSEWIPGPGGPSPHAVMRKDLGAPRGKFIPPPEPVWPGLLPQQIEEGTWDIRIQVFENGPDQPPTIVHGSETNVLMPTVNNELWFISTYHANFRGMPFEQHGIVGYDPDKGKYVASWVKTVQANLGVFEGTWDDETKTLTLEGMVQNCFGRTDENGRVIIVRERRITRYLDRNTKHFTLFQQEPDKCGKFDDSPWIKRDESEGKRRPKVVGVNIPRVGEAVLSLVALQRGDRAIRVVGENTHTSQVRAAAGMVMLGPAWLELFGDSLRL